MFVNATPGDKLLKMLQETESIHRISDNCRIKFVSESGIKLKHILQKKDPFEGKCKANDCVPCRNPSDENKENSKCRRNRIVYECKCKSCGIEGKHRVYHGETVRNLYIRSKEHYSALRRQCETNFMYKHVKEEHNGNLHDIQFEWKVIGQYPKPLSRQLSEAIHIEHKKEDENLNSKNEYFRQNIQRIGLNQDMDQQCGYCGRCFVKIEELENHEKAIHTRYTCKECDYKSFGTSDLKIHMQIVHRNV